MATKVDIRKQNPQRYAVIKLKQDELRNELHTELSVSVECPFCYHKVGRVFKGIHAAIECKCDNCGEIFVFPPIAFSKAKKSN